MASMTCKNCDSRISLGARVCPHCRTNPRFILPYDHGVDHGEWRPRQTISADSEAPLNMGCVGLVGALLALGLVIMFFEWLGSRISLFVGPSMMPLAGVLLFAWLIYGVSAVWFGSSNRWNSIATYAPFTSWAGIMLLVMFFPLSQGTAPQNDDSTTINLPVAEPTVERTVVEAEPFIRPEGELAEDSVNISSSSMPVEPVVVDPGRNAEQSEDDFLGGQPKEVGRRMLGSLDSSTDVMQYIYQCSDGRTWYIFSLLAGRNTTFIASPLENGYLYGKKLSSYDKAVAALCSRN